MRSAPSPSRGSMRLNASSYSRVLLPRGLRKSGDLEHLDVEAAAGGDDGHLVPSPLADQGATNGRLVRDQPLPRVGLLRANQVVGLLVTLAVDHLDVRAHTHIVGPVRLLDHAGAGQHAFEILDAALDKSLLGL